MLHLLVGSGVWLTLFNTAAVFWDLSLFITCLLYLFLIADEES